MACPVALRASSRRKTGRSVIRGMTFSIPTHAMWIGGRCIPRSALPSFVQITTLPVSATAKGTAKRPMEQRADLMAISMDRRYDDVGRNLIRELDDSFPQIGVDDLDSVRL
jgi:hypothetical protein